ncbi:unnamed protein product [Victoria cruziana]
MLTANIEGLRQAMVKVFRATSRGFRRKRNGKAMMGMEQGNGEGSPMGEPPMVDDSEHDGKDGRVSLEKRRSAVAP